MIYAGLLTFFLLEYVRPTSYVPALLALHLNSIVPLSTFFGSILASGHKTVSRMASDPNTKFIGAFLVMVWMSFLTADVQEWAWNALTLIAGFAVIYWVMGCEVASVRKVKGVIVALVVVHLLVAALNPVLFTDPETRHYVTSGAFLGDGNDFALSIDIMLPLCLFLLTDAKRMVAKAAWGLAILVLVAGVVVTQSRGGTIGLAFVGAYYWAKSARKLQAGIVVAIVFVLIMAFAPGNYFSRMKMIGDTSEGSASARLTAWGVAVQMATDNPLLGVGAGHFGVKIGNEYRPAEFIGRGMNAHSIYFQALGELGFPGFIGLIWLIVWNLSANRKVARAVAARRSPTRDRDLQLLASTSASLIAYASAGAFLSAFYYPHMYVVAGLMSAVRNVVRQNLTAGDAVAPVQVRTLTVHPALRPAPRRAVAGRALPNPTQARQLGQHS